MADANVLVITGYGVNSHRETAHAAYLAGADRVDLLHFADIAQDSSRLLEYGLIVFPGGFLDGDDLGAAQAAAMRWRYLKDGRGRLVLDALREFLSGGGLMLGICNGFQLLVKLGILPGFDGEFRREVSLAHNDSGRYEDRWVKLAVNPACECVFTKGLPALYIPVRHGEGRIVASAECLARIRADNLIALQYAGADGKPTQEYPFNPNSSPYAIAGLTNPSGHVLGLMPHPEAFHHVTNHPAWTRAEIDPPCTLLFVNAMRYLRDH
ncbi:MAG: phosphoribosylformylglycinamidine synthase subunit PurQ [Desulfovibrio sp.]|nr:phosphoribosylformylglycinamidine synthase subunit PurQ [Desulfovibrio sp.]